jgi:hypothetical protein
VQHSAVSSALKCLRAALNYAAVVKFAVVCSSGQLYQLLLLAAPTTSHPCRSN